MKRTYDVRRIKSNRSYSVPDLARLLNVNERTVYGWIKQGLPVIDNHHRKMVHGPTARDWLKAKQVARRWTCGPGELPCFKCKGPRAIKPGSFNIVTNNTLKIRVVGTCSACGKTIGRGDVTANRAALEQQFTANQSADYDASTASNRDPQTPLNHHNQKDLGS
ncbi:MAG: helix-turn-helix domain-containing protein [Pseudomonadota bacterium]